MNIVLLKEDKIKKTIFNKRSVVIRLNGIENVSFINVKEFYENFIVNFLGQEFITKRKLSTSEKIEITRYLKYELNANLFKQK